MINFNGKLYPEDALFLNHANRGLRYGDALFETIRVVNGEAIFWEDHYLRLMASMRILRMEIPMNFTMEFLEEQMIGLVGANDLQNKAARIRLTVFRNNGGLYTPSTREVSFIVEAAELSAPFYTISDKAYSLGLFKDFYVNPDMLSTLKSANRLINVVGSIYAKENDYDNCVLLNTQKSVVEALNGNLFLVKGNAVKTPSLKDGCLNGIVRKKLIHILNNHEGLHIEETTISPFELQKADEIFVTNSIMGIQPVTNYRKKVFESTIARDLLGKLNTVARLERS